jgi:F-type H+-transporting ATPase subunit b
MRVFWMAWAVASVVGVAPAAAQHDDGNAPAHATNAAGAEHGADAEHSGAHGPEYQLMTLDAMTAIWTIVVFVLLLILLRAAAWNPIQKVLVDREKFITDSLAQAKADREAAEARLTEYEARLQAAGKEAAAIVDEARRDGSVLKQREEAKGRDEAEQIVARAKREIELATDSAVKELYARSAKLATDIAARVIRKELDAAQHERLIAESIEELQTAGQA